MTTCKECGHSISATAKTCPQCGTKGPKPAIWPWLVGVPLALVAALLLYGASIPEYEADARRVREICEKLVGPFDRLGKMTCDSNYHKAIREGKAAGK